MLHTYLPSVYQNWLQQWLLTGGLRDPAFKLAVLHLSKRSTTKSLMSLPLLLPSLGRLSMAKGSEDTDALSKKGICAFDVYMV